MKLVFITEARFARLNDDRVYSLESSFAMPLYRRYLEHFDEIIIFARTKNGTKEEVFFANLIDGEHVKLIELPYYIGFSQFLCQFLKLKKSLKKAISKYIDVHTTVICRVPGRIGSIAIDYLKAKHIPYGIEVVGDPYDVLSNGATNNKLAPVIRYFSFHSLRKVAVYAPAALYVTKHKLQERYPCNHFSIGVSDVVMPPDAFVNSPKVQTQGSKLRIVCVGSLDQMYKAPDLIIKAVRMLIDRGISCELKWIGEGAFKKQMIQLANQLNIGDSITFTGKLSGGEAVRKELDESDLFVMASRMEGLPRAMVEAMARALPCIGTDICGIPELLDQQALVKVNDITGLADKIQYFIEHPDFAFEMAKRNLEVAYTFEENILNAQRKQFYDRLKNISNRNHEKKKVLLVANITKHILRFHLPYLKWFQENGYETHVAANGNDEIPFCDVKYDVPIQRSPFSFRNRHACKILKRIINENNFQIVHGHTPMGGVLARLASKESRLKGTKVLYTAHGFHFFKGAPLINWMLYYPMEKHLASCTDAIITINREDYQLLFDKNFKTKGKYLISGIGVNEKRLKSLDLNERGALRNEMGYPADQFILVYVAEFIPRKNHQFIIDVIPQLRKEIPQLKVLLAGRGVLMSAMKQYAADKGVADVIDFLGFREDIGCVMAISDLGISASLQEGLGLNLVEEMFCGLPVVATLDRGHKEMVEHGYNGFLFEQNNHDQFIEHVCKLYQNKEMRDSFGIEAIRTAQKFSLENSLKSMAEIYQKYL